MIVNLFHFPFHFFFLFLKDHKGEQRRLHCCKQPFVTRTLQIFQDVDTSKAVYLTTEICGCRPTPGNGIIIVY